jgi:hypothetical protein
MPYGVEVAALLKGSLTSAALLPQSNNQLGDTWVIGHTPWVWICSPGFGQLMWVDAGQKMADDLLQLLE